MVLVFPGWIPQKISKMVIKEYDDIIENAKGKKFYEERIFECKAPIWVRHFRIEKKILSRDSTIYEKSRDNYYFVKKMIDQSKYTCINIGFNLYYKFEDDTSKKTIAQVIKNFSKKLDKKLTFWGICINASYVKKFYIEERGITGPESIKGEKIQWDKWIWEPKKIDDCIEESSKKKLIYPVISNVYDKKSELPTLNHIFLDKKKCPNCKLEVPKDSSFCMKCGHFFNDNSSYQNTFVIKFNWNKLKEKKIQKEDAEKQEQISKYMKSEKKEDIIPPSKISYDFKVDPDMVKTVVFNDLEELKEVFKEYNDKLARCPKCNYSFRDKYRGGDIEEKSELLVIIKIKVCEKCGYDLASNVEEDFGKILTTTAEKISKISNIPLEKAKQYILIGQDMLEKVGTRENAEIVVKQLKEEIRLSLSKNEEKKNVMSKEDMAEFEKYRGVLAEYTVMQIRLTYCGKCGHQSIKPVNICENCGLKIGNAKKSVELTAKLTAASKINSDSLPTEELKEKWKKVLKSYIGGLMLYFKRKDVNKGFRLYKENKK